MANAAATSAAIPRHFGMDWLRIGAFALLILYHIGMFFVPWGWHIKTGDPIEWLEFFMLALSPWRLSLLFLVSGFASCAMLSKPGMGLGAFFRDRTVRLLVPLAAGIAFFVAPQPWIEMRFKQGYDAGFLHFWLHDYFRFDLTGEIPMPTYNHLWFVLYLFAYTALAVLAIACIPAQARAAIRHKFRALLSSPLRWMAVPVLFLLAASALIPEHGLGPQIFVGDWYRHAVYLFMFTIGFLLAATPSWWRAIERTWQSAFVVAVAGYLLAITLRTTAIGAAIGPETSRWLYHLGQALQAWGMICGLLGMANAWWNRDGPARNYLALGVFPFYIIHQTIIVVVAYWALSVGLGQLAQFAAIFAATCIGCWLFYEVTLRAGQLRPVFGLK